jgi:uncharacterized protein with GYD domain
MPKYLIKASLTVDGLKGLLKDGGTSRREAVARMADSVGGQLDALYWAFGEDDVYAVLEAPDNTSMAAIGLTISAAGAVRTKTVVLLTPEEVDQAVRTHVEYQPPGT